MRKILKLKKPSFKLKPMCAAVLLACSVNAGANPNGGAVVNGSASFNTNGNTLTVSNTPGTIINWQGFSINSNEITHFAQQSASSAVLNRVITNNPSVILGTLSSNGRVFLVNPGGIVFGAGSTVDVAGMVATSLNLSDADFLAGRGNFTNVPGAQAVSNAGNITAQSGGEIYLIAPNVENSGVINAPNGEILLAAGSEVQLVNTLDPNLRINITAPAGDATNVGQLVASAGRLGLFGTVVKNTGTVNADSATLQGGKIVLRSSQRTEAGGTVTANGTTGGTIKVLGNEVGIMDGATVSANGTQDGGTILIGGDKQGANPNVQNAQVTYVAQTASISADAIQNGSGGKVIIWADDTTRAYGSISARGGVSGGNGGFVETSGKRYLDVTSAPDVSAPAGRGGQWLLDPHNVTIQAGAGNMDGIDLTPPYFMPAATDNSTLDVAVINAALNAETTIEVTTGSTGIQLGTITVAAPITKTAGVGTGNLFLTAANEILINADITASSGLIQLFTAATQVDVNANITLNGGAWDATGGGATVRVDSGTPIINAPLYTGTVNVSAGTATFNGNMFLTNLTLSGGTLTGTGAISIPNTGTFNWTGNSVMGGSGTLTTQAGSTTTLMPGFAQTVALRGSRVWDNSGVVTFTPNSGTLSFFQIDDTTADGTAVFNNLAGGQFNVNASFSDTHTIGVGTFNNAGILNKNLNGTAQSSRINPAFNNQSTGVVNVISGTLTFGGTGIDVAGSTYNVPIGSTLNFGASRTVAGSIAGAGSVGLYNSGGVVGIGISGSYNVSGATSVWADCCGSTAVTFTGPVNNIGTTFTGSPNSTVDFSGITSGEGTAFANLTNINSSSTLTFKTGTVLSGLTALTVGGGILELANSSLSLATLDVTGGTLTGSGNIDVSGAFNWTGNSAIAGSGTLTTQVGGATALAPNFNQTTYLVGSRIWNNYGTVTLTTNATGLSHFQIDDTLADGTAEFNNLSGGVFNLDGTLNTNHITGVGTFNNAGIFYKNLNVSSSFAPVFNNQATGVVNVTSGALSLNGIGTDIAGSAYNIASGTTLQFGASRTVPGSIAGAGIMSFAGGTTTVSGSYNVSGSTQISGTTTATFAGPVTNVGTSIVANSGTTVLNFSGITTGEATAFANLTSINSNSTLTFKIGTVLSGLTALTVGGGTLDLVDSSLTLTTLDVVSGALTGSGNIYVSGAFNWGGSLNSFITGSGTLTTQVGSATALTPGFARTISLQGSRAWNNYGTVNFNPDAGTISYFQIDDTLTGGTAVLNNMSGGVFNINASYSDNHTTGVGTFNNAGILNKNLNGTAQSSGINPAFNNQSTGVVNVTSGTLTINGALTQSGLIEVAAGATFSKAGGFSNSITGTLAGAGTISVGTGNSLGNIGTISPGMRGGDTTGTLSIVGNLSMGASSILNIDINSPLAGDYDVLSLTPGMAGNLAGTLNLSGVAPAGSYSIFSSTGGMFGTFATVNSGTFTQTPTYDTGNQLVTLTVTANTNVATAYWTGIAADFNWATAGNWSSGIAPIAGDKVYIGGGAGTISYTPTAGQVGTIISDGALNFVAGDLTVANASTFRGAVSFNGSTLALTGGGTFGSVSVDSGTSTLNGTVNASSLNVNAGSLTLGGASTVSKMNMVGGTLTDNFGLAINGSFNWSGGTITSANGSIFTTSGATTTTITGNATMVDNIWQNAGTVNFNGTGDLSLGGTGVAATIFTNQAGGVVNYNGSPVNPIVIGFTATNKTFNNAGTLNKNAGSAATQSIGTIFNNTGSVKVQSGILVLPTFTTNDGTVSVASGATAAFNVIAFTNSYYWNGSIWVTGVLEGAGTIDIGTGTGTITNNGIIAPGIATGDTTGTLSIVGNLVMGATGQLNLDLNGVSAGNYDVLAISGTADITTANINLKGFGDTGTYTVLTTGGLTGTGTINSGYFTQTPTYTANNLSLGVTSNSFANAVFWDGGAATYNWADALNWSANVLPTATDNVYIATLGANSLLINSGAGLGNNFVCDANFQLTGGSLTLGGTSYFNGTTSISGGTLSTAGATQMGTLNWTGGTITGVGVVDVSSLNMLAGTTLNGVNVTSLNGKTMNVNGNTSFSSGAANGSNGTDLTLLNGAIVNNNGIWSIDNVANIIAGTGGGTFNNFGEVRVGQTVAATATISALFNNDNSIFFDLIHGANIGNGSLIIAGGGTSIFDAFNTNTQPGTTIEFTNGYNFNVGGNFGLGDLILSGGQVNSASTLRAVNITVAGAVTSSGALSLAANNNILLAAGSSLSSSSGALNINLYSDFNGTGGGGIYLDAGSSINSNGGNISMGGMPSMGYAIGNGTVTGGKIFNSGIYVLGDITAGAGNVTMRGEGRAFGSGSNHLADGITFAGGLLSSNGMVDINGVAHVLSASTAGTDVTAGVDFLGGGTRLSTQTGTVTVTGLNDAGAGFCRAQGITVEAGTIIETTGTGTLTLNGTSTGLDTGWGVGIFGGTVRTTAAGGGAITLYGINVTNPDGGVVILDGNVLSSGGEIRIIGEGLGGSGTIGTSTIGGVSSGNILIKANNSGPIDITAASSINAGSNTLTLELAGGTFNDNGGAITASGLRLLGSGTFNLGSANNNVGTLAANVTGSVTYNDTNGFAIGSVTSFDGTAATTTTGVTTGNSNFTGTTAGNITLNAGNAINTGTANVMLASTAGNFINNSGSATPITANSGKIYSTSPSSNTKGGMVPAFSIFNCAYPGACGAPATGIGFLYTQATAPILTIVADALSKVYGSSDPALTYAVSGLVGDDLVSIMTGAQSRVAGENAGTYAISQGALSVPAGYGYTLSYTGNNLTITPALLTLNLSASNASKIYGTALTFAGTEFTPVGLIAGDSITGVTLTSTGAVNTANAGAYSIDITPGSEVFGQGLASNYNIINYIPGTLTVNPAPLTVSANAQSKIYGSIDPALTYTSSGLLFADTLAGSLSRGAGENVGSYSINQGTLANPNYSISYTGNTLGITQRIISVIADISSKVYGDADPNLFTVGGSLASWDTNVTAFTGSLSHTGGENVGTYAITQGSLLANANYNLSGFTGNNLTITPAPLTVVADSKNKVLGTPDPLLTYMTYGLKVNTNLNINDSAATTLSGQLDRDVGDTIGTYSINQGNLTLLSSNYTMTYVGGTFRILAPTVVQEITQTSLQPAPAEDTATTSEEEEKKKSAELLAEAAIVDDSGQPLADPLPVCR